MCVFDTLSVLTFKKTDILLFVKSCSATDCPYLYPRPWTKKIQNDKQPGNQQVGKSYELFSELYS